MSIDHVDRQRGRAALVSVFAAMGLVAAKLVAGVLTNSIAMLSEAGHSSVDLLAALITFFAVKKASPPDQQRHFGHAKFESLGALVELSFLFALSGAIVYNALKRLLLTAPVVKIEGTAIIFIVLAVTVDIWRTVTLHRAAKTTGSEALAASAMHFLSDLLGTVVVLFGLGMAALGYPRADSISALIIAGVILVLAFKLSSRVLSSLTDKAPEGLADEVRRIVLDVDNVIGVHEIRVRRAGRQIFTDMHVDLDYELPLGKAHAVLDQIELTLHKRYPEMNVVTHPEPMHAPVKEGHDVS